MYDLKLPLLSIGATLNHALCNFNCSGLGSLEFCVIVKWIQIWSVDSQKNNIKTVATRCQILSLKCTKFDFG